MKRDSAVLVLLILSLILLNACGGNSQNVHENAAGTAESVQESMGHQDESTTLQDVENAPNDTPEAGTSIVDESSKTSEDESPLPVGTESSLEVTDHDLTTGQESTTIFDYVELDPIYFEADVLGEEEAAEKGGLFHGSILESIAFPDMSYMKNTIFGADDRQFLNYSKRTTYPYCSMVSIEVQYPNGDWYNGSGFLTGSNTVATCAHMLYNADCGGAAEVVEVYAGRDGSSTPYGMVKGKKYSYYIVAVNGTSKSTYVEKTLKKK